MNKSMPAHEHEPTTVTPGKLKARYPRMSAAVARILALPEYAYWHPTSEAVRVEAVAFAQPEFLAGPFDGQFGLVYVEHTPDAAPIQEQLSKMAARIMGRCDTTYMPYTAYARLAAQHPEGSHFYWDAIERMSYSDIDLQYLPPDVQRRLDATGNRCQIFANTPEGQRDVLAQLTPTELEAYIAEKTRAVESEQAQMVRTIACAERPYRVRLQGTDDSSWTISLASEIDVAALLEELGLQGYPCVCNKMVFTN